MSEAARSPIACTLTEGELGDRVAEWQQFFVSSVVAWETEPTTARLQLADDDGALLSAASLGQREKECCRFFDFAVEIGVDHRWLVVSVPADAAEALSGFMAMMAPA